MTRSSNLHQEKKVIVVIGEETSGKTCLTRHLVGGDVEESLKEYKTTVDESHYTIQKRPDGTSERLQIIDTAPWQEFPVMHRLYIRTCDTVIVVYNVAKNSWKETLTTMIEEIRQIKADANIVVVGTHADQRNVVMNITPSHVREVIGDLSHAYTSAVSGFGISHLWHILLNRHTRLSTGSLSGSKTSLEGPTRRKGKTDSVRRLARKTSSLSSLLCTSTKYQTL